MDKKYIAGIVILILLLIAIFYYLQPENEVVKLLKKYKKWKLVDNTFYFKIDDKVEIIWDRGNGALPPAKADIEKVTKKKIKLVNFTRDKKIYNSEIRGEWILEKISDSEIEITINNRTNIITPA